MLYHEMTIQALQEQKALIEAELEVKVSQFKYENREKALKSISVKTAAAMALIKECEQIAQANDVHFSFDVAYGMGGTFCQGSEYDHTEDEWGWQASSQSC